MLSCAVRLCLALLTLDPFLLLVANSITIALLLIGISLRVHVTESGGLQARRSHTDLAPHVPLTKLCLLLSCGCRCCRCSSGPLTLPCTRIFENSKKNLRRARNKKHFRKWQAPQKKSGIPQKIWGSNPGIELGQLTID